MNIYLAILKKMVDIFKKLFNYLIDICYRKISFIILAFNSGKVQYAVYVVRKLSYILNHITDVFMPVFSGKLMF